MNEIRTAVALPQQNIQPRVRTASRRKSLAMLRAFVGSPLVGVAMLCLKICEVALKVRINISRRRKAAE